MGGGQEDLATPKAQTKADPRLPGAHGHASGPPHPETPPPEGAPPPHRIIHAPLKAHRLTKQQEFDALIREGLRFTGPGFVVYVLPRPQEKCWKLGFMVAKKRGSAPERNRFKRICRDFFWKNHDRVAPGCWYLVLPRQPVREIPPEATRRFLEEIWKKLHKQVTAGS